MKKHFIGQIILHYGRYKVVRKIGKGWIETIYLKPNDKGWCKVEKIYEQRDRPLKIEEYKALNLGDMNKLILERVLL